MTDKDNTIKKDNVIRIVRLSEVKEYAKAYFETIIKGMESNQFPEHIAKKEVIEIFQAINVNFIIGLDNKYQK